MRHMPHPASDRSTKEAFLISTVVHPRAAEQFGGLTLRPETLRAIERLGWRQPTPIQARVIPLLTAGRDLVGQAQTGSGKTGAYGIPLVERLSPAREAVQALVLVPTRELALQVAEDLRALGSARDLTAVALFGGQPIERQMAALRRRPPIAVATPGRLLDHLQRRTVTLQTVAVAVLDEADRMLDMGFLPDVTRILQQTPGARQTALFSATMPAPIRLLAERFMRQPVWVCIDAPRPTVETVEQYYLEVMEEDKVRALRRLLVRESIPSAVIFRRTKHRAEGLARVLGRERAVGLLHGGMRQEARLQALRAFAQGCTPLLVTTNVASRGLDLPQVSHVINFDMPEDVETYIHRVGRTARMGRHGTAITFVGQHDLEMFDQLRRRLGDALRRHPLNLYA
ncbi:MAG: DEAD/DEAH box helicase [Armatimonadota bacterium]|nr:DEAD/DEAH box helicase [Armatimonadota bacterium]MDR7426972.1 DEAD/DEAH box helicase [Armatimonadota bacterium]MDR7463110.1 DEAD/DEAH box helicase [Armatimonadota bacterium]MDR7469307.1 DEAD/DEAH box helicase [Armatimonadota bacterium]MDR7475527.1 DEAD/DEAH box helicase [Armatimonadota bacterium]